MARSRRVSVTPSTNQNKIHNILKFTYSQIFSQINAFTFIINVDIVTMGRNRRASVTPLQIRREIIKILNWYKHHQYLYPEEVVRAKLNSYNRGNHKFYNKKASLDYNKILRLRQKTPSTDY